MSDNQIPQKLETVTPRWSSPFDKRRPLRAIKPFTFKNKNDDVISLTPGELFDWQGEGLPPRMASRYYHQKVARHCVEDRNLGNMPGQRRANVEAQNEANAFILDTLKTLDPEDDLNWDEDGKPSVEAVSDTAEEDITREQIEAAAPDFNREKALEEWAARVEQETKEDEGTVGDTNDGANKEDKSNDPKSGQKNFSRKKQGHV